MSLRLKKPRRHIICRCPEAIPCWQRRSKANTNKILMKQQRGKTIQLEKQDRTWKTLTKNENIKQTIGKVRSCQLNSCCPSSALKTGSHEMPRFTRLHLNSYCLAVSFSFCFSLSFLRFVYISLSSLSCYCLACPATLGSYGLLLSYWIVAKQVSKLFHLRMQAFNNAKVVFNKDLKVPPVSLPACPWLTLPG